ncbi:MAG: sugar phosphate isomerase/epimerase [Candidatus Sumerlaeota bacterium]|nr:sugar phosphate isomerase/epimerase [Candidatus Sumerlaeota bacterium]
MTFDSFSRRQLLFAAGASALAISVDSGISSSAAATAETSAAAPFRYCLNTGTIRGYKLALADEVDAAAKAGYQGIEPWISSIHNHAKGGGSLKDLAKRISDAGLTVESAIGFGKWAVDDDAERAKGLEDFKRDMDAVAQIGGKRIAAPPAGVNSKEGLDLMKAAARYRTLLEMGDSMGVTPQVEIWGASKNLNRLSSAIFVALESGHPKACILPDVFHLYKGGSDFNGLKLLSPRAIQVFHLNDYPANPPREKIGDADRIWPGDGIAPLTQILRDLRANGGGTVLSIELFNPSYWKQDALTTAKTGLEKMKAAVQKANG